MYGRDDTDIKQEAQLSPRDPRDALYMRCCFTVAQITHTDPDVSLRSTFSNCHVLFGYLQSFVHASLQYRLSYRIATTRCCWCYQQTFRQPTLLMSTGPYVWSSISTTTKVVDDTAYSSASVPSWTRTSVADGHKCSAIRRVRRRLLDRSNKKLSYRRRTARHTMLVNSCYVSRGMGARKDSNSKSYL